MPPSSISDWTISTLTKFVKDILNNEPRRFAPSLSVEDLTVTRKLTLEDEISFPQNWHIIGSTGEPAFSGNWTNYGSPYAKAAYYKDAAGFIRFTGIIKATGAGDVGTAAFTLPPGFRPPTDEIFVVISNNAVGRLDITSGGVVTPVSPSSYQFVSLSGVAFKAA